MKAWREYLSRDEVGPRVSGPVVHFWSCTCVFMACKLLLWCTAALGWLVSSLSSTIFHVHVFAVSRSSVLWTELMMHAVQPSRCMRFILAKSNISPRVRQERTHGSIVCLSSLNLSFALVFQTNGCVMGCRSLGNDAEMCVLAVCCSLTDTFNFPKPLNQSKRRLDLYNEEPHWPEQL